MQALEVIHSRILQRIGTLADYNKYLYYSLARFGNCAAENKLLPTKDTGTVKLHQQLNHLETNTPARQKAKRASLQVHTNPIQTWVDLNMRNLGKETIRAERLRQLYRKISTPIVASQGDLGDFEAQLNASNMLDQFDEIFEALARICREIEARMPEYKRAYNGLQQAPMTMDPLTVDWPVADMDPSEVEKLDPAVMQVAIECLGMNMKEFQRLCFAETAKLIEEKYKTIEVSFPARQEERREACPECDLPLIIDPYNSELRCQKCGFSDTLSGVVFEESQLYSQQSSASKHKNYKFNVHCEKWLNQIQARENRLIPEDVLQRVNALAKQEYTRGGILRSMRGMKCKEIRKWLKRLGLTKYNNNAALIRRYVTGMNGEAVIPPQLTAVETHDILFDFSQAMEVYESFDKERETLAAIGKAKVGNKPYYPYGLMKILINRLPRGARLDGLLECIHLQTETTLRKHDKVWKEICARVPGFHYVPTNKALLSTNFG